MDTSAIRQRVTRLTEPSRIRKYARTIARSAAYDLGKARRYRTAPAGLDESIRPSVESLRTRGYAVLDGYRSAEFCRTWARRLLDTVPEMPPAPDPTPTEPLPYTIGVHSRVADLGRAKVEWRNVDHPTSRDRGVICVYHVDDAHPELRELREDLAVSAIVAAAAGQRLPSRAYKCFINDSAESTRGYHTDQSEQDQFKSFLFLTDVTEADDGAHSYVPGTHLPTVYRYLNYGYNFVSAERQRNDMTKFPDRRAVTITCPAGTLLIVDITGFHRALPQRPGRRRVVLNNCYDHFTYGD